LIGVVPMPVTRPTSCAFGPDGALYITTARTELAPEVLTQQPEAGSIFAVATSTRGVTVHPFEG
jgi:sugar lactone lactonase YvrE